MPESKSKKDGTAGAPQTTADSAVQQGQPPAADPVLLTTDGGDTVAGSFSPDAIQVVAKCDTFRRAGFVFTRSATTLPLAELSQQQLAQLCQEPMLVVQAIRLDAEG
ncbi:HI1506-related protein [Vogesella mureinivorans]|uniref:HI1506-related protein n=1 Tax=Vogesella mureinivorans TaxID=657276 RepID=UPI0011C9E594|nr:HI1506-related protein [Vogesella mureinivorans]